MSTLSTRIRSGSFVVTTELTPPKGVDLSDIFSRAEALKPYVDAINLTESPRARMAIEPTAVARLLFERGIDPIVQFTARDRNRIALQADILGAAALGVNNLVFMAGDDPRNGDHPEAIAVFDLNTVQMIGAARSLSGGHDLAGNPLRGTPQLFIGATANPSAHDFDAEVANTRRKIDAGAQFLQTQAVYDAAQLERFLEAVQPEGVALLAGIIPLKSSKMAAWLNGNVPGIRVPQALVAEVSAFAGRPEDELKLGVDIAARIARSVRPLCAGVHLMTLGWEQYIPEILARAGIERGEDFHGDAG